MNMRSCDNYKNKSKIYAIAYFLITISFGLRGFQIGPFKLLEILLINYCIFAIYIKLINKQKVKINIVDIVIFLFIINVLFGILINSFTDDTFITLIRLLIGILIYAFFSNVHINIYKKYISFGLLFTANYIFIHNLNNFINFISGNYSGQFVRRMSIESSFGNPNFVSNFLLIPFNVSIWFLIKGVVRRNIYITLYNLLTVISIIILMIVTQSRGSLVALFINIILYLGWFVKNRKLNVRNLFVISITILIIAITIIQILPSTVLDYLYQRFDYDQIMSGSGRNIIFRDGLNKFLQKPIFGVGLGNFKRISIYNSRTHNLYLELLVETGLLGFILFIYIIYATISMRKKDPENIPYYFSFIALLINGMTINMLDLRHLWLIIGILNSSRRFKSDKLGPTEQYVYKAF